MTKLIDIHDVSHTYEGKNLLALDEVSLRINPGEFVTLLGPSGSGKTTLLKALAGLLIPDGGVIRLGDRDITRTPIHKRDMGFVFQNYALFPHLSVHDNVAFPLRVRRVSKKDASLQVKRVLELVGLTKFDSVYPRELSGGQQQRVALARALIYDPDVLLLDEPLGALDRAMRDRLADELRRLQRDLGITTVYVTHDRYEALVLSNRIAVMNSGRILQYGTPQEIYLAPSDSFVAQLLGEVNTFRVAETDTSRCGLVMATSEGLKVGVHRQESRSRLGVGAAATELLCAIRPESFVLTEGPQDMAVSWRTRVVSAVFGGSSTLISLETEIGRTVTAEIHGHGTSVGVGAWLWASCPEDALILLPQTTTPET